MVRSFTPVLLALLLLSALTYGAGFMLFRAQTQEGGVRLEWQAPSEQGVSSYDVYRQDAADTDFDQITSLSPTAQAQYRYFDETDHVLKGPVTYRLLVRTASGTRSYQTTPAPADDNPMVRSWGLIKVMFR
ncbi:hypothetical protein [Hymenobacter rubripertinctus]|uniref:Fibronectin type III domain-containing protein n=1 Tax=Hymenobacter rubripertinctus TaxID=2029981 RepID=A0A418QKE0_9BACT|nr:hypothetical protein [Hymenobacter rubripertinctus]RIY05706.1 hypothetical protein D0T11_19995 [Hymenobacter rubripertinctus]